MTPRAHEIASPLICALPNRREIIFASNEFKQSISAGYNDLPAELFLAPSLQAYFRSFTNPMKLKSFLVSGRKREMSISIRKNIRLERDNWRNARVFYGMDQRKLRKLDRHRIG